MTYVMSLQRRCERYVTSTSGKSPNVLYITIYPLRGTTMTTWGKLQNSGPKDSMSVIGPRLWNTLPKEATLMQSLQSFKSSVKGVFSQFPDRPPNKGYPSSKNSILDYALNKRPNITGGGQHSYRYHKVCRSQKGKSKVTIWPFWKCRLVKIQVNTTSGDQEDDVPSS